ncbi:MAG: hypothetical protein LBM93_07085, partial [Oscillospiraceae bacterium]|nr:hypothetical protein [Oscillospiraceae bacterium]
MNNKDFLLVIKSAFEKYRVTSSRSNEKLRILHSAIAIDIEQRLNSFSDGYEVFSLAKTKDEGSKNEEKEITGRYMNKKVDIVVAKNDEYVAGF